MGTIITMYGAPTTGTMNALAQIDVPMDGRLQYVQWACHGFLDSTGEGFLAQLSFGSAYSLANDSRQLISHCSVHVNIGAAGVSRADANYGHLVDLPVQGGERIYLHAIVAGTITGVITAGLGFSFDLDKPSVRRR